MTYEIWTAHRYGHQFGLPENKLMDNLSEDEVVRQLRHLQDTSILLHTVLVVREGVSMLGNHWLRQFGGEK